ncbi:hypothetical protein BC939DRAFT_505006 [Gamsiella multidivaricata]|uniref:uncharacterized protein n=1 Tax=Gamsiella multidivaricata TaxID=101098 RepID=UPI00221E48E5|nr:uncharacterized protein BC939DRAFT_505006 [Gamsiella multidivaricata]KAG0366029.1 hypothetical protein BGZ54_005923 [Gamsiella multidivaricata]KAI7820384.1 hypothetical protein BC939DRAFT_505006 [Gamsiella multidivaricata]
MSTINNTNTPTPTDGTGERDASNTNTINHPSINTLGGSSNTNTSIDPSNATTVATNIASGPFLGLFPAAGTVTVTPTTSSNAEAQQQPSIGEVTTSSLPQAVFAPSASSIEPDANVILSLLPSISAIPGIDTNGASSIQPIMEAPTSNPAAVAVSPSTNIVLQAQAQAPLQRQQEQPMSASVQFLQQQLAAQQEAANPLAGTAQQGQASEQTLEQARTTPGLLLNAQPSHPVQSQPLQQLVTQQLLQQLQQQPSQSQNMSQPQPQRQSLQQQRSSPMRTQQVQMPQTSQVSVANQDGAIISSIDLAKPAIAPLSNASSQKQLQERSQQQQHDLQQLQEHNARLAAAMAPAESGGPVPTPQNNSTMQPLEGMISNSDNNSSGTTNGNNADVPGLHLPPTSSPSAQSSVLVNDSPSVGQQQTPPVLEGSKISNVGGSDHIVSFPRSPVIGLGVEPEPMSEPLNISAGSFEAPGSSNSIPSSQLEGVSPPVGKSPQIFKATYSGVPVFEMICRGVAVMRRRSDSYLNATQILKVAEFDKPQRTRILEREVQTGEHEKVQGGYGKYQGTWVPYDRGVQLCQEYNVLQLLQPLLEYQFSKINSPPLAPKHVTAATNRPRKPREPKAPGKSRMKKSKSKGAAHLLPKPGMQGPVMGIIEGSGAGREGSIPTFDNDGDDDVSTSDLDDETQSRAGTEASMDETMSILSAQTRTPSPIESRADLSSSEMSDVETNASGRRRRQRSVEHAPGPRKKQNSRPGDELFIGYHGGHSGHPSSQQQQQPQLGYHNPAAFHAQDVEMRLRDSPHSPSLRQPSPSPRRGPSSERGRTLGPGSWQDDRLPNAGMAADESKQGLYAETLLNYFVSDSVTLPSILTHPPPDLDFDLIIDEEGHTPLHWAVAMARTKIVKLLVQHGADIYRVNNQGQTALMRSVLFTNNFDLKTFPTLLEILQKTIFTIDKNDQTVFHHVAVTAGMRGKVHASRYYMECLLDKLTQHPQELASIINVQDVVGDTALIIAARIGNKKVVRLLLEKGADPKIRNKSGRNADDFLQDTEMNVAGSSSGGGGPPVSSSFPRPQQQSALPPSSSSSIPSPAISGGHHLSPQQHQQQQQPPPHHHHQQLQQQQRSPAHPHQHHHNSSNIGSSGNGNPQRMSHTVSQQQPHHHQGAMPPSASTTPRIPNHPSPNPHGHPSSTMRSITPPPPRQGGHTSLSSNNLDRSPNAGYQDYPPNRSPRNPLQSHLPGPSAASPPLYGQRLEPTTRPNPMYDPSSGRGHPGFNGHPAGPAGNRGLAMERTPSSSRDPAAYASAPHNGSGPDQAQGRPSKKMIPVVTELFEQLTQAYEKDLYEKEQDLLDARNMLQGIQVDIQDGRRAIDELRSKTMYLRQAEDQVRTLEGMIRHEINLRQRLKLEHLVAQEETRLRREMEEEKEKEKNSFGATGTGAVDLERVRALEKEAAELRSSLAHLQQTRKDQVEQVVQLKSQQGKRRHEYKRLIALCCNVSIDEVDGLLGPLLSTLGSEDGLV